MVCARSLALMPVVTPLAASMETVKPVPILFVFIGTCGNSSSVSQISLESGMQINPRPSRAMKLMASGVQCSASMARSPSFSRPGSSTRMIILPALRSASTSGMDAIAMSVPMPAAHCSRAACPYCELVRQSVP